ncbi:hypothetical protein HHI36_010444 [Cryptolaemus montrouzieri]|uniref:Receptor L-domain domain-containing protein n=1 Tax=Cryptolaemus montrouzieri TaxID=559131 RepID=A0ABD2MIU1_9CUCU
MFSRFSLLVLCFCCASVCAKICRSTDIRTHVGQFDKLKNCTKVVGFLKLVLLEDVPYYPSFPELREITGYLLVFFVTNVYDLGDIFPNLLVIRGNILLQENSLIIHHNNRMKQAKKVVTPRVTQSRGKSVIWTIFKKMRL